uniref:DUF4794 domain-containing protein n=1 Tax=Anopheles minimus TaxID=112268 RepID=A0A182W9E0_9DIPT
MTISTQFRCISCIVYLGLSILHTTVAIPVIKSGPGIEIMPAEFSQDGKLDFVVVDENKDASTNNQLQPYQNVQPQAQQPQIQYQQPVAQQPQYQYVQPQSVPAQPQAQQPYYSYQQPQYVQPAQYPGPATYYSEPPGYSSYYAPPPPSVGPIGERGGFSNSRYSSLGSDIALPLSLSAGATLLGAALLFG